MHVRVPLVVLVVAGTATFAIGAPAGAGQQQPEPGLDELIGSITQQLGGNDFFDSPDYQPDPDAPRPVVIEEVTSEPYDNFDGGPPGESLDTGAIRIDVAVVHKFDPAMVDADLAPAEAGWAVDQAYDLAEHVPPGLDPGPFANMVLLDIADAPTGVATQTVSALWSGGSPPPLSQLADGSIFDAPPPPPVDDFWQDLGAATPTDDPPLVDRLFGNGGPLGCDRQGAICPGGPSPDPFANGFTLLGLGAPPPGAPGPGYDHEIVYSVLNGAHPGEPYFTDQFFDLFNGTTDSYVLRPGGEFERLTYDANSCCASVPTQARVFVLRDGSVVAIPLDEADVTAWRGSDFMAESGQRRPGSVASVSTAPADGPGAPVMAASDPFALFHDPASLIMPSEPASFFIGQVTGEGAGAGGVSDDASSDTMEEATPDALGAAPAFDDSPTRWPLILTAAGGLLLAGGAYARSKRGVKHAEDDDSDWANDTDAPWLTDEEAAHLAAAAGAPVVVGAPVGDDPSHRWELARTPELAAQARINTLQAELVKRWAQAHSQFKEGMLAFAEAYLAAWMASEPLRQRADDWRVEKEAAWAIDTALGLIALARGVFSLGRGLAGFVRARQAAKLAAKGADELAAARAAANAALEASSTIRNFADDLMGAGRAGMKGYRDELVEMIMWGQEAGVDVVRILDDKIQLGKEFGMGAERIINTSREAVVDAVAGGLGLVEATGAFASTVENATATANLLLREGARMTPRNADNIRDFVRLVDETPGFFDDVGNMFVKLARGSGDDLTGEVANLVSADGVDLLRTLYRVAKQSGDDFRGFAAKLTEALGPAKVTAARAAAAGGGGPTAAGAVITGAHLPAGEGAAAAHVGAVDKVDDYMGQYGITNDSFGGNLWDLLTSPVDTVGGMWHSWQALDELDELLDTAGDDLRAIDPGLATAINALENLVSIAGDDQVDRLEGALHELERAQQGLRDVFDAAPKDWRDAHQQMFDDRMAHIDQKRAAITNLLAALRRMDEIGQSLVDGLTALRAGPEGQRSVLEYIDPELSAGMAQVAHSLEGINYGVTGGGAVGDRPPPSWDEIERASAERSRVLDELGAQEYDPATDPDLEGLGDLDGG